MNNREKAKPGNFPKIIIADVSSLVYPLKVETVQGTVFLSKQEVEEIITCGRIANNPYYLYSNIITKDDVKRFFFLKLTNPAKLSRDTALLKKIAYYVLFYAENITLAVYLTIKAENQEKARHYLKSMTPLLKQLRKLYTQPTLPTIEKMIDLCLDYLVDPF